MVRLIRAIYENGVFRPLDGLEGLPDQSAVSLRIEHADANGGSLSDFAGLWPRDEAEEIEALIEAEFER